MTFSFDIATLRRLYTTGALTPSQLVEELIARLDGEDRHRVWIQRLDADALRGYARALEGQDPASLPLYGVPFAIKDNIDLAGVPTTAGCPAFAYTPTRHATVVQRLLDAGAIPVGKTNLDQFATGLNGTRSPYGACRNAFHPDYISGGSSSGSAVAVALGLVSFALGTDTAGSGRVPAAFNHLIGHKPTCGALSTRGVVPACRSLDQVSIFALTADDAERVLAVAAGFDAEDEYSRPLAPHGFDFGRAASFTFGVPMAKDLEFFGNGEAQRLFGAAVDRMKALGGTPVDIDLAPFLETARLLYGGPWVAERYLAIRDFFEAYPDAVFAPVREIIGGGRRYSAADTFAHLYRLRGLKRVCDAVWDDIDVLLTPTVGTIYRIAEMEADPIRLNANLGHYTNFVNLLDLAATAVPAGFQSDGLPFGVTLIAPAHQDAPLLHLASRLHQALGGTLGATAQPLPPAESLSVLPSGQVRVAVVGAHLSGLPLNAQLTGRGGRLVTATRTAPRYRLYALPDGKRPGLARVASGGAAIACEVWELPLDQFGSFVAGIPAPLGMGQVELADGTLVNGFICEPIGIADARDITAFGGWRAWLAAASTGGA
ncbi:allophanate hydrolase [Tepidimonas taiwanensis]|uniref:Allophanate hydrolase n=1 Tax=Tepidimonas taiwanensis TaxID=307486 RepID=A0A554XCJ8_9BURK|nr:allophanate hydrolase [Tepidimonas taiwanensis]MCX7693526.1 allophanate hydrolase [Tepidimonas taiwanensis]TSE33582.1 Allophanate hydrolase [Tepidimonas taiwanensis]UBQ05722.1 allophanate hydrolase [Tepidimonas taiwanensis]